MNAGQITVADKPDVLDHVIWWRVLVGAVMPCPGSAAKDFFSTLAPRASSLIAIRHERFR